MHREFSIFIAIGANIAAPDGGGPLDTCRRAAGCLDLLPGLRLRSLSRWYRSVPVPYSGQPAYVNGAACLRPDRDGLYDPAWLLGDPARLLARLMDIETKFGRRRGVANAARSLDLDIIGVGDTIRAEPDPILPHPRAHERGFVLAPLADIAPDWVHPVVGRTVAELLAKVGAQGVSPIEASA